MEYVRLCDGIAWGIQCGYFMCYLHEQLMCAVVRCCLSVGHPEFFVSEVIHSGPGSLVGIATCYELDGPGIESRWGARLSAPVQTGPGAHPASCTMGTGSFPGVKSGRGVTLTPHSLLVPWSWKSRAIPLLPLWALRPVQSLRACTRVYFTFTLKLFVRFWIRNKQITIKHNLIK